MYSLFIYLYIYRVDQSMYHALAYSGIMCIQALLKFEQVQYDYIAFIILDTVSWNDGQYWGSKNH